VHIVSPQPPLRGNTLRTAIDEYARDLIPEATGKVDIGLEATDLVFVLGDSEWRGNSGDVRRIVAGGWAGGIVSESDSVSPLVGDYRLGAGVAAAVAAVEPFKLALRAVAASKDMRTPVQELLEPTTSAIVSIMSGDRIVEPEIDMGSVDFVSGGAITSAALHCLLRIRNLRGHLRVIEPEKVELSNLNRYALARRSDVDKYKANLLAAFGTSDLAIESIVARLDDQTVPLIRPLSKSVAVGSDSVPSRWLVQSLWPEHLVVGATAEFMTMTSSHRYPGPCAGCVHPVDDAVNVTIPSVSFVSYWAGLLVAARLLVHAADPENSTDSQVSLIWPLRLDLIDSILWHPLHGDPRCPVRCPASRATV
jgi:hypothetical protein